MEHISNHLAAASNLVQAVQESKLPAIGEDKQLVVALQDKKIREAPLESLKEVLRLVMVKLGLRANNWPNDEEKAVLLSHIITNYGNHTPKEVLLAFEMAIAGKLDVDPTTYENFSCLYFSEIMNAYRLWAKEAYKMNVKEVPMIAHKEDLSDKAMADWYESVKEKVIGGMHYSLLPVMISEWKKLDYQPYLKTAAIEIGKNLADRTLADHKYYAEFKEMYRKGEFSGVWVKKIEDMAKRMVLNDVILKGCQ